MRTSAFSTGVTWMVQAWLSPLVERLALVTVPPVTSSRWSRTLA